MPLGRESGDVPQGVHFDPNGKIRKEGSFIYQALFRALVGPLGFRVQVRGFRVQVLLVGFRS